MPDLELSQVKIRLTQDQDTLDALRARKQFRTDKKTGKDFIVVTFNSQELRFSPGDVRTLGKSVAESLYGRSFVIIGDDLTGPAAPIFDIVEEINLSDLIESDGRVQGTRKFACPVCNKQHESASSLGYHLTKEHSNKAEKGKSSPAVTADEDAVEEEVAE